MKKNTGKRAKKRGGFNQIKCRNRGGAKIRKIRLVLDHSSTKLL